MFKPVLQQIRLLGVALILSSHWIKLRQSHAIHGCYGTCCKKTFALGPQNAQYFLQPLFETCSNLICCKKGLNVVDKKRNTAFQLLSQQCCKTSCTFLLPALPQLKIRLSSVREFLAIFSGLYSHLIFFLVAFNASFYLISVSETLVLNLLATINARSVFFACYLFLSWFSQCRHLTRRLLQYKMFTVQT